MLQSNDLLLNVTHVLKAGRRQKKGGVDSDMGAAAISNGREIRFSTSDPGVSSYLRLELLAAPLGVELYRPIYTLLKESDVYRLSLPLKFCVH